MDLFLSIAIMLTKLYVVYNMFLNMNTVNILKWQNIQNTWHERKKLLWRKVVNQIGSWKNIFFDADSCGGFNLKRCTGSAVFYCDGLRAGILPADGSRAVG